MTKDEALKLALEALEALHDENMDYLTRNKLGGENNQCMVFAREAITAIKEALAQPEQDDRRLQIAMRQWEDWKTYALELQKKLVKYEGGSPMLLNTQPEERNFCPRCGKRTADPTTIHTCTPPREKDV